MSDQTTTTVKRQSLHGQWSTRMAFILAVTGSAVGLGNIWKFPYIAGENGGGAFVLIYLLCVFVVGLPIMMSEILIGRRGRRNPVMTMKIVGEEEGRSRNWALVGIMGIIAGVLILSFYSVIAGWAMSYVFMTAGGTFVDTDASQVKSTFELLSGSWKLTAFWHTFFIVITVVVVAQGVQRGLERLVRILMPALLVLLLLLLVFSMNSGYFGQAVEFMFRPNFSALTPSGVLIALGHAFFTLSLGMGAVMAYGAYLPEGTSITSTSVIVVLADTGIALLAGLIIFPVVFANNLQSDAGPGLIFQTLPLAFGHMPGGVFFGTMFFVLLSFAAWTSSIGMIEPAVAWMTESKGIKRAVAASILGGFTWLIGFGTVFSWSLWKEKTFFQGTFFDNIDYLISNIALPLGGLMITIFAGWVMCRNSTSDELNCGTGLMYKSWRFLARYIAPIAVILVLIEAASGGIVSDYLSTIGN
ncbi:MAG: sodium-dependent transporter [Gammaproteobacteria bacterium]|nr:sodium-dependent transporter [Gammaproteobacteria bacterium]